MPIADISESDFLFCDKPAGFSTHSANDVVSLRERAHQVGSDEGLVESLQNLSGQKLWVCHRLDRTTSGAIVFARNEQAARWLSEHFRNHRVEKTYLFITDRAPATLPNTFMRQSLLEKSGSTVKEVPGEANSETRFEKLHQQGPFSLWQATPRTGRTHQIRVHASAAGIPILGDGVYGGRSFARLCLHSAELRFSMGPTERSFAFSSAAPAFFKDLSLLVNTRLCSWLTALDRRQRWLRTRELCTKAFALNPESFESWRAIHTEGGQLRVDVLGQHVELQWFADLEPNDKDWHDLRGFLEIGFSGYDWRLQLRTDRGANPNQQLTWQEPAHSPQRWLVSENGLRFEMRTDSGLSTGLFLDQRSNRKWLQEHSADCEVLNLFAYTGGFSVAAAAGGAQRVVTVDVSKNFIDWSRKNFEINQIPLEPHLFYAMDAREYVSYARRKGLQFDRVICDPPSFGRGKSGVFRIEKDLAPLLESTLGILAPHAQVLMSSNFEGWSQSEFVDVIESVLRRQKTRYSVEPAPHPDWDFEEPHQPRVLKSVVIRKLS